MDITEKQLRQLLNAHETLTTYPTPRQRSFAEGVFKQWRINLKLMETGKRI